MNPDKEKSLSARLLDRFKENPIGAGIVVLGVVVMSLAAAIEAIQKLQQYLGLRQVLEIIDAKVVSDDKSSEYWRTWFADYDYLNSTGFAVIDITVRNLDVKAVAITSIDIDATRTESQEECSAAQYYQPPSLIYNVALDPDAVAQRKHLEVSQVIPAQDIDRFLVVVGHAPKIGRTPVRKYSAMLQLNYDRSGKVRLSPLELHVRGPSCGSIQTRKLPPILLPSKTEPLRELRSIPASR